MVTVNGTLTHAASGTGTITVGGLVLNSGAKENFNLGFPGGAVNDLTMVNGALTLGGTLNISALFGFGTGTYDLINYTGLLTPGTIKFGTLPAGFTAANFTISTATNGQVDLIVNGGPQVQYWDGPTTTGTGTISRGGSGTWDNVTTSLDQYLGFDQCKVGPIHGDLLDEYRDGHHQR